jgi:hypothetical protein
MSAKLDRALRKHARLYNLPKNVLRKIRKLKKNYNLNLTETLYLIDKSAEMINKKINEVKNERS